MIRSASLRRRVILVLGMAFVLAGAVPAWRSWRAFWDLRQARRYIELGEPMAALPLLAKLAENAPHRADLQYRLGVAQRRAGNVNLALTFLGRARELGWSSEDVDRQELLVVVQTGQTQMAERLLEEAVQEDTPDEVAEEIYEALAVGYIIAYQLRDGERCLDYWIRWQPEAIPPRFLMAGILRRAELSQNAMRTYEEILAIEPEHRPAHMEYAKMLLQGNRIQDAFAHFKYCAEVDPRDPEARLGLAECYNRMGQSQESRAALESVLKDTEDQALLAVALVELGRLAIKEQDYEEAVEHLRRAVKIEPLDTTAHFTLGSALVKLDRTAEARVEFDRSKQLRAKFDRLNSIREVLVDAPANPDLRYEAGTILMDLGMKSQGMGWLRTVLLHDRRHRRTHEALAAYFEKEGNVEQAASHRQVLAALDAEETAQSPEDESGSVIPPSGNGASGVQAVPPLPAGMP